MDFDPSFISMIVRHSAFNFSASVAGLSRSLGVRKQPLNIALALCGGTKPPKDVPAFDEVLLIYI